MNLTAEILKEHSKTQAAKIAAWAGSSTENFAQLVHVFLTDEYRVTQRAGWPLGDLAQKRHDLVMPYLGPLIQNLQKPNLHDAVKRNTVRLLQDIDVPEEHMGLLADICMGYLADPKEPMAVKAFSMTVMLNITKKFPDLKNELKLLIEDLMPDATPGLLNRGNKVLAALDKL